MIPNIIHQTYKTQQLPADLLHWHRKVISLHPGWQVNLWTDADNLRLVEDHFPHLLEAYNQLPYNIMRVDMVRYMYMVVYGGVYIDLDYELFTPLNEIISNHDLILPLSREKQAKDFYQNSMIIGNCIFASARDHIFWHDVLDTFHKHPPIEHFSNKMDILQLTGPEFLTGIYFQNPGKYHAFLPKKYLFHPDVSYATQPDYEETLSQNGTLGLHHCKESWLKENNSISNIMARAVSSFNRRIRFFMS